MTNRWERIQIWLAIVAIAVQAGWPLLAQARPRAPDALDSICSAEKGAPSGNHGSPARDHCKLCATSNERDLPAVAPPSPARFGVGRTHEAARGNESRSGARSTALASRPRAPPVS